MHSLLWTVSTTLVFLPVSQLLFLNSIQFLPNEWFLYLSVPFNFSLLLLPHHTQTLQCRLFSWFRNFFANSSHSSPFENLRCDERITRKFFPLEKCINFQIFFNDLAALYKFCFANFSLLDCNSSHILHSKQRNSCWNNGLWCWLYLPCPSAGRPKCCSVEKLHLHLIENDHTNEQENQKL